MSKITGPLCSVLLPLRKRVFEGAAARHCTHKGTTSLGVCVRACYFWYFRDYFGKLVRTSRTFVIFVWLSLGLV